MSATGILVRKELLESWRTYRLPVVAGLFLLVGLTSPLLARFLPEIIKAAGGDQLGNLQLPTPTTADAVDQLWKNLAQFGAFAAIILAMGAVATERDRGTAAFILSKTATRGAFLGAKAIAIGAVLAVAVVLAAGGRLDLHRDPVRADAGRWLDRAGDPGLARPRAPGRPSPSSAAP